MIDVDIELVIRHANWIEGVPDSYSLLESLAKCQAQVEPSRKQSQTTYYYRYQTLSKYQYPRWYEPYHFKSHINIQDPAIKLRNSR